MRPYLILEGPDGGGKSTLAAALAERGYHTLHTGPPTYVPLYDAYMKVLVNLTTRADASIDVRPIAFDRFHIGERVYGPLLRENDRLGPVFHRMLDRVLLGLNACVVYCETDKKVMMSTWQSRAADGKELFSDGSVYHQLFQLYDEHITTQELPVEYYDYRHDTVDTVIANTSEFVKNEGPGIGNWHEGAILLVAEQIARPSPGSIAWPYVGSTSASVWLTERLIQWKVPEARLYWVNALAADGSDIDASFIDKLKPSKIIALGDRAADWCIGAGHRPIEIPSPTFWKRFKFGEPYPLKEHLV